MARRERSVPTGEDAPVQRLECRHCGMSWNRPPKPGRLPRFCSDACKQASWRRQARDQHAERASARPRQGQRERFHAELAALSSKKPLPTPRILPLLRELAQTTASDERTAQQLYKAAVRKWHPDAGGDAGTFTLLQLAYRRAQQEGF